MAITALSGQRWQGSSTGVSNVEQDFLSETGGSSSQLDETANKYGIKLESNNPLIDYGLSSFTMKLKKNNSPTGNISAKIYKGDSTTATATSTDTVDASTLTGSFVEKTWNFVGNVTLASGDRIVFEGGSHDGTNQIVFERSSSSFTDTVSIARYTSSWVDGISGDPLYKVTTTQDDKSIVTDVPTGSQFEETDTRKFYQISVGDGSAQNTNIFNLTYSTEKQATITSGNDPTGKCVLTHTGSNPESKAWTTELTSGSTKTFEIKFTVARGSNDTGNNWGMFIGSDVWDDNGASGTNKRIGFRMVNGNRVDFILDSGSSTSTEDDTLSLQGTSTTKYYTITGNGTSAKCEYWSTSARSGTPDDATGNVSFPTGWLSDDAFDTITFGAWGGGSNAINVTFNEVSIKWDSGVATTWVERGTAI